MLSSPRSKFYLLDCRYQRLQSHQSLKKHLALLLQRNKLLHGCTNPEKLTNFIKSPAEARCRREASKSTHGVVALLDAAMILFQVIVEIMLLPMENVGAKDLPYGTWVRPVPIRDHSLWRMTNSLEGLLKKALGRVHISLLTEHGVNQIPILINSPIQVAPLSLDSHVCFINMPGNPCLSTTSPPQLIGSQGSKSGFPISHRLMSKRKTTFQEHLSKITQAQLITQPRENDEQGDIRRVFEGVKRSSRSFMKNSLALLTVIGSIAKRGFLTALPGSR